MEKKLKNLKDAATFRLSNRSGSVVYKLQKKIKGVGYFTSLSSDRNFNRPLSTIVFID